ncbi:RseA family anti-sigma factor [Marinomonas sp.]|nr:RseA family anti-sigma factor [Marinomonas sp.]MDB4837543.1 RseA family anti-sigma factor [Marinomonas sp.]
MTEQNNPMGPSSSSLSAMFDGEATDQDIEYLLIENSKNLDRQLNSFNLISHTLKSQADSSLIESVGLAQNIRDVINEEAVEQSVEVENSTTSVVSILSASKQSTKVSHNSWKMMFSSVAVAASVSFVVIFGGDTLFSQGGSDAEAVFASSIDIEDIISLAELEQQEETMPADNMRLQHYLRQHAEQSAMTAGQGVMPMARVVSYPIEE